MLTQIFALLRKQKNAKIIFQGNILSVNEIIQCAENLIAKNFPKKLPKRIAFCLPNSPQLLAWHIACLAYGIESAPLIWDETPDFLHAALKLIEPDIIITSKKIQDHCQFTFPVLIDKKISLAKSLSKKIPGNISENKLAFILFSSGGTIKGSMHSYKTFQGFIDTLNIVLAVKKNLTYLVAQPMGHIGGIITTLLTLLSNGTVILLPEFSVKTYLKALGHYKPTHINLHTPLFYTLLNQKHIDKDTFSHIKTCFASVDSMNCNLPEQFTRLTGAPMQTGYGATEAGIILVNRKPYGKTKASIGKIIDIAKIKLCDEKGKLVSVGMPGEIWVKSPANCLGYFHMKELTREVLQGKWFKTGDLAACDSRGNYWYYGRVSAAFYYNDYKIFPIQIEQALYFYPAVEMAAVIGIPVSKNKHEKIPVAFVKLKNNNMRLSEEELKMFLENQLPKEQLPAKIIFVKTMPLNFTGKIDRKKLLTLFKGAKL